MNNKIRVVLKAPGHKPYSTSIDPSPENIRKRIGGDFQMLRYAGDCCVICAKKNTGLDYNCEYLGRDFYGLMIWVGYSEKGLLPFPEDFNIFRKLNFSLFEEFEREQKKIESKIVDVFGLSLVIGLWGWIGYELAHQILEYI